MKCVIILFDIEFYNIGAPSELCSASGTIWIYLWSYVFYKSMMRIHTTYSTCGIYINVCISLNIGNLYCTLKEQFN